jgi:hypothetical protein
VGEFVTNQESKKAEKFAGVHFRFGPITGGRLRREVVDFAVDDSRLLFIHSIKADNNADNPISS